MPLNLAALTTSPGLPGAGGADYPLTTVECADAWANAVAAWAAGIVPPVLPPVVLAARSQLKADLLVAFQASELASVVAGLETAFATFAVALGAAMTGFVPTPPVGPVGFATLFTPPYPSTRAEGVAQVANALDTWLRTGSSALAVAPFTVTVWS